MDSQDLAWRLAKRAIEKSDQLTKEELTNVLRRIELNLRPIGRCVMIEQTHTLYELGAVEFPMLCALRTLTLSLSNTMQSAPGCTSQFTVEKWREYEAICARMHVTDFVDIATCTERGDAIMDVEFPGWSDDWE